MTALLACIPAQADAFDVHAPQRQPQQSAPEPIVLVPGETITRNGVASSSLNPQYIFNASAGQNLRLRLTSPNNLAYFQVQGVIDNRIYASSSRDWSQVLTITQDYLVTVSAFATTSFTLEISYSAQSGQPKRITFAPGQTLAQETGTAAPGQSPQFIFTASSGQTLRVVLYPNNGTANFSVRGVIDNRIYKADSDPSRDWSAVLTVTQDYLITVTSPSTVNFTLQIFLSGVGPEERITFAPGQSTAVVSGFLQPNTTKTYVFYAASGRTIRLLLSSQPPNSANFSVVGVSDGFIYKQDTDPAREWSYPITVSQDYRVTVFSGVASSYTLEVTVPTPLPPTVTPGTPIPTVPAGCTSDTIQNGSFEVDGFWVFGDTPIPPAYNSVVTHTPLRSMRLGNDPALGAGMQNAKGFSSIRQPFQISASATIAQLRWWNFYRTEEGQTDTPGLAEDKQQVVLLNPDLTTVAVLRSVRRNTGAWQEELVDLTPYRGRPLLLYFNVYNDGNGLRTWQYVDNVVINVCYPDMTATPIVPTPVPTMFPTLIMPTVVIPTAILPTAILPTVVYPTAILPTAILPTGAVGPTLIPPTVAGDAFLTTPPLANGEPVVIELPPDQQSVQAAAVPARVEVQPTVTSTPRPAPQPINLIAFNRPLNDVLTWAGIMLGVVAIIGILVALIWQASNRRT